MGLTKKVSKTWEVPEPSPIKIPEPSKPVRVPEQEPVPVRKEPVKV